mmetsp:Transcript_9945/g.16103  ORF Transcript_9945/g.16103 Transcript_9945/m.16103 type:complete len:279 (-) Transcript_9945:53-889(-)
MLVMLCCVCVLLCTACVCVLYYCIITSLQTIQQATQSAQLLLRVAQDLARSPFFFMLHSELLADCSRLLNLVEEHDHVALHCPALAHRVHLLMRPGLDVDLPGRRAQQADNVLLHGRFDARHLGLLKNESYINIANGVPHFSHSFVCLFHKNGGISSTPLWIIIWKYLPYIRQGQGSKDGVDDAVVDDVPVRVRLRPQLVVNLHPSDDQLLPGAQAVDVIPVADADGQRRNLRVLGVHLGLKSLRGRTSTLKSPESKAVSQRNYRQKSKESLQRSHNM